MLLKYFYLSSSFATLIKTEHLSTTKALHRNSLWEHVCMVGKSEKLDTSEKQGWSNSCWISNYGDLYFIALVIPTQLPYHFKKAVGAGVGSSQLASLPLVLVFSIGSLGDHLLVLHIIKICYRAMSPWSWLSNWAIISFGPLYNASIFVFHHLPLPYISAFQFV